MSIILDFIVKQLMLPTIIVLGVIAIIALTFSTFAGVVLGLIDLILIYKYLKR